MNTDCVPPKHQQTISCVGVKEIHRCLPLSLSLSLFSLSIFRFLSSVLQQILHKHLATFATCAWVSMWCSPCLLLHIIITKTIIIVHTFLQQGYCYCYYAPVDGVRSIRIVFVLFKWKRKHDFLRFYFRMSFGEMGMFRSLLSYAAF